MQPYAIPNLYSSNLSVADLPCPCAPLSALQACLADLRGIKHLKVQHLQQLDTVDRLGLSISEGQEATCETVSFICMKVRLAKRFGGPSTLLWALSLCSGRGDWLGLPVCRFFRLLAGFDSRACGLPMCKNGPQLRFLCCVFVCSLDV